ncbi:MAG: hypothetical protein ACK5HP_00595 [Bacilli bacterium]
MKKKIITVSLGILIVIGLVIFLVNLINNKKTSNEPYNLSNLQELFPTEKQSYIFEYENVKYDGNVVSIEKKDDITIVTTEYEINSTKRKSIYEISNEKVIETINYIENDTVVSIIYPTEIIVGIPFVGLSWKSVDGLVTNTVTKMINNQVTIESVRTINGYEDGKNSPIEKDYKEIRVYEKGKGIVFYSSEIVND